MQLTLEELTERQERLAEAMLKMADVFEKAAEQLGFSPGRGLVEKVVGILDGAPEPNGVPSEPNGHDTDDEDDGED